jgi:hypothetical protein
MLLCSGVQMLHAQSEEYQQKTATDTVYIEGNTLLFNRDSLFFVENDTVIYLQDTIRNQLEALLKKQDSRLETQFFESLRQRKDSSSLSKRIINALTNLEAGSSTAPEAALQRNTSKAEGKIIRNIRIRGLEVFGTSLNDTADDVTSGIAGFANRMHMYTREKVLRNRLLLEAGDIIGPDDILDNERIIRTLPYIRDARLIVKPVKGDTVDLLLISQDLLAYTAALRPYGLEGGKLNLGNINMLGYGHQLENTVSLRTDRAHKLGYIGQYRIPNLGNSQVEAVLRYENTEYVQAYRAGLERNFITPNIMLAGGIDFSYRRTLQYDPAIRDYEDISQYEHEQDIPRHLYKRFSQDYWIARSLAPDFIRAYDPRSRLVLGMRYFRRQYYERPSVDAQHFSAFHNRELLLFNIGFSKRYYTTETLVYGFGRTEDIPIGGLAEITLGPEKGEFHNRFFTGLSLLRGRYVKPIGYLSGGVRLNGYWSTQELEDGLLEIMTSSFSYPIVWKKTTFRFFLQAAYSRRIQPVAREDFRDNMVSLNDDQGIRGLRHYTLYGHEKLSLSLESVAFLPYRLFSFRFAVFGFADVGWIADQHDSLLGTSLNQGYGLGLRVRSDRLAFRTFQLRLSCYPSPPAGESFFRVSIAGIPIARLMDFNIRKPAYYID